MASINNYEIVISPGLNKTGWYSSVYRIDHSTDELMVLVGHEKCTDYVAATQKAWKIMQEDRSNAKQ